ncbi:MAG: F0F1 ATP synthase subunit alpha [Phycisphaerae bacterium]|jgi:F-type H+-transporting ATPase subunit alpha|nr:F0F1 ATP synthase subunit alpha [Phycisphaerae bacterium]
MKFNADEITSVIREEIARFKREMDVSDVGRVLEVGDGIAQIFGLGDAMAGEMLEFEGGAMGQVFNLEQTSIGAVIYSGAENVSEGTIVHTAGHLLEVPVGMEMIGRVVDPLGMPLDGLGPIASEETRPVEVIAPGIALRQPVTEPLHTGLKAVDSMTPIGRGQRELIIGDRKTGKTAIAIDAIINQKDTGVLCVYVAVGQKESTVAGVVETLRTNGAMAHTIVVSAASSDPAPLQYIAPYSGCTMAEYFMNEHGRHTLVIYDDLSKQAAAYRQISLLLRRPPGREAYPGDVFYLHSRLLERACKLADRYVIADASDDDPVVDPEDEVYVGPMGFTRAKVDIKAKDDPREYRVHRLEKSGGSMTALPICETQEGEVAAYIPTNLISITDGQIYLEPSLFFAGVRPAINAGISVSRVGYKAADPAMKEVAKSLRLDLASFRELEAFAQMGMELDPASQKQLDRGQRIVRLLTQMQYAPMDSIDQAIAIFCATGGLLDDLSVDEIPEFETSLLEYLKADHSEFYEEIAEDRSLDSGRIRRLRHLIDEYKETAYTDLVRVRKRAVRQTKLLEKEAEEKARREGEEKAAQEDATPEDGGQEQQETES